MHDLAMVAERRDEPTISLEEMKKRLRRRASYSLTFKSSVDKELASLPKPILFAFSYASNI